MNVALLPDPPDELPSAPQAFYDELRRMLAAVQPPSLSRECTSVRFHRKGVEIDVVHDDRHDWRLWASVGEREAIVSTSYAHEHFWPRSGGEAGVRPWTTEIVDFIAELMRGEVEIHTTFRGHTPISVEHFNLDADGERRLLGHTGFLVPARLFLWRPTRTDIERLSFD
jgi:hypothetical protein